MRKRHFPALIAATCCCLGATLLATPPTAAGGSTSGSTSGSTGSRAPYDDPAPAAGPYGKERRTKHSSDGVKGKIAPRLDRKERRRAPVDSNVISWPIAPGVNYQQWDRADARGTIRAYLVAADLDTPGLAVDYLGNATTRTRDEVSDMTIRRGGLVGINADFFDISDTGTPLGFGVDRFYGLLHGVSSGWNTGFYIDSAGAPQVGELGLEAKVAGRKDIAIGGVNAPSVADGKVGIYTPAWGTTTGSRVTDGQRKGVREVVVSGGRVVRNGTRLSDGRTIDGFVLVGRGGAAKRLGSLRVGKLVRVKYAAAGGVRVAVTGNRQLVDERVRTVVDDREMHPRTAIGIDRDTNSVLMLVIDGRQSFSRGYTMVELANLMIELGAEDALNLDGGGSSTMVGLQPTGALAVLNSPSDGQQRAVPDGLALTYLPPPD